MTDGLVVVVMVPPILTVLIYLIPRPPDMIESLSPGVLIVPNKCVRFVFMAAVIKWFLSDGFLRES